MVRVHNTDLFVANDGLQVVELLVSWTDGVLPGHGEIGLRVNLQGFEVLGHFQGCGVGEGRVRD